MKLLTVILCGVVLGILMVAAFSMSGTSSITECKTLTYEVVGSGTVTKVKLCILGDTEGEK